MVRLRTAAAAALLLAAGAASAQSGSPGSALAFAAPDGWTRSVLAGGVALNPPALQAGRIAGIVVQKPEALPPGGLTAWGEATWRALTAGFDVVQGNAFQAIAPVGGHEAVAAQAVLRGQKDARVQLYVMSVGVRNGGRVERIQYLSDLATVNEGGPRVMAAFLAGVRFPDSPGAPAAAAAAPPGAAPPPAPLAAGPARRPGLDSPSFTWGAVERPRGRAGLDGIYRAWLAHESFDASTARSTVTPTYDYYVFFPDGRYYAAEPEEGLDNFAFGYWQKKNPVWCGRYEWDGKKGSLVDQDGDRRPLRLVDGGALAIDGKGPFRPMPRVEGIKLSGTYKRSDWRSLYGADSQGAFVTFHPDGRFEESSLLAVANVSWWMNGQFMFPEKGPGRGTWEVKDWSLVLRYDDGRRRRVALFLDDEATLARPDAFRIRNWRFVRQ